MSEANLLKNKSFSQVTVDIDIAGGLSEAMFWHSQDFSSFSSTVNLAHPPIKGSPPFFFINEEDKLPLEKLFFLPSWKFSDKQKLEKRGKTFLKTQNNNDGFIAQTKSLENGNLNQSVKLVGFSYDTIVTHIFAILGNLKDFHLSFYHSFDSWFFQNPIATYKNPQRDSKGIFHLGKSLKFKVVSLVIYTLNESFKMPKINLLRPANFYTLKENTLIDFNIKAEVKGDGFATGIALRRCELSFIDNNLTFDRYNPNSPFYSLILRNFVIIPRIDYFRDSSFSELVASYHLGKFYGDPIESTGKDLKAKIKGFTRLGIIRTLQTNIHYYTKASLSEVIYDLFKDLKTQVILDPSLSKEILVYQFFGGETLEKTLRSLCDSYSLIVSETIHNSISVKKVISSSYQNPKAFFSLSNEFSYTNSQIDKVINRLTVKNTMNTLSDENLKNYWSFPLLPDISGNSIKKKKEIIEKEGKRIEESVIVNTQSLCELPRFLTLEETKKKIYPPRHPQVPQPEPTLEYEILLGQDFDSQKETYIKQILFSKDNNTSSQPSYLEFEWWNEDCFYKGKAATLLTVRLWVYQEAVYDYVEYERNSENSLVYDDNGYAKLIKATPYKSGEEGQSLFFGEAEIVPPLKERGKLLKTENITLKSLKGRFKEINEENQERCELLSFEASKGQIFDKIESDLIIPSHSKHWLWVKESFYCDRVLVHYLNLSASIKNYEIKIYGREFTKKDLGSEVYENKESQYRYGEREGSVENLKQEQIEKYLYKHAKPWEVVNIEVQASPLISVGDIIQYVSEYNVLSRGQVTSYSTKRSRGNLITTQLTALNLNSNAINPFKKGNMGTVGSLCLG